MQANGTTERPAISADGRVGGLRGAGRHLQPRPRRRGRRGNDVFVRNLAAGTLAAASDPTRTTGSSFPDISGDGRYVVFETGERYDPVNDPNALNDVYRRDMGTGAFTLVSAKDGSAAARQRRRHAARRSRPTACGWRSPPPSTDLIATDTNAATGRLHPRHRGPGHAARVGATGPPRAPIRSDHAAIAANGGLVGFIFDDAGRRARG